MATCGQCSAGSWPSNTDVTIDGYGDVVVKTQLTEQGTGNRDVVVRVVAEVLDISPEHISLSSVTTNDAPTDWGSFGSRSTNTAGMSAMLAAQDLKKKLIQDAEKKLGIPAEDLEFGAGVFTKKSTGETFPLIMTLMMPQNSMSGTGHWDGAEGLTAMSMQYVMVEVDLETGLVKLVDHVSSTDCGCIINPRALNNQFDSFYAGTDVALTEETIYDPRTNHVLNANMIDYKTRTFNGVIPHKNVILESFKDRESVHPFGAFGTAETAISPGGSAISMAIYNACGGIEVPTFPILPGKMLAALKKKKEG